MELIDAFVKERKPSENFSTYWGRTHVNGPVPKPEQFYLELRAHKKELLVSAEA